MDATSPGQRLTAEHRQIDAGIAPLLGDGGEAPALQAALALLRRHIHAEETVLFPPLAQQGLAMPVFVMKREHGLMWPLIVQLEAACTAGAEPATLREPCRQLFQLLQMHNGKEEQIVYGAADRLPPAAATPLGDALAAARLPVDWRCELAPR